MSTNNGQWSKEKIWNWYNSRPWIRGCNFMSSDCNNRIDQWQAFGFEKRLETTDRELALAHEIGFNSIRIILEFFVWDNERDTFMRRLDRYLELCAKHKIDAMIVLGNDCMVPKSQYDPPHLGEQEYFPGSHGNRRVSPHGGTNGEMGWHVCDDPDTRKRYMQFVREVVTAYAHDERVSTWNVWNEPGNNRRGTTSLPYIEEIFAICREADTIQPCAADVWRGIRDGKATTEVEQAVLEMSDFISWHNYSKYSVNIDAIEQLQTAGRPLINTEWLNRCNGQTVEEIYPLYYLEKVGCYNWGFVVGKYQTNEPYEGMWRTIESGQPYSFDVTKWMHDLFRPNLRPYDPREIDIIKKYNTLADERFAAGRDASKVKM